MPLFLRMLKRDTVESPKSSRSDVGTKPRSLIRPENKRPSGQPSADKRLMLWILGGNLPRSAGGKHLLSKQAKLDRQTLILDIGSHIESFPQLPTGKEGPQEAR